MKTTDLFTRNRSAQRLNESLSKMFGTQLDLDSFDTPKLEDARNKLRTQIHTARTQSGFNETIENEALTKAQFMHDAIVAELMDRQEHIVDTTVEEGAMSEIAAELGQVADEEDYDKLYDLLSDDGPVGKYLQDQIEDITGETGLHPKDDIEKIEQMLMDHIQQEFGGQNDDEGGETDDNYALASAGFGSDEDYESIEQEGAEFGAYYHEKLAQKIFDENPDLNTSGRAEEVMSAGFKIAVADLGKKQAQGLFGYDEDFPSDFVSSYSYLQKQGQNEGVEERVRDPEDWDEGDSEPPNNFAVSINGKQWKVFKGRGQYADDDREKQHYRQLKDWAAKKSESTGKKWEVSITGENPTESTQAEGSDFVKGVKRFIKGKKNPSDVRDAHLAKATFGDESDKDKEEKRYDKVQKLISKESTQGESMSNLREGEVQQASAIVTAKTMVDRVSRWIEELSGMENDTLLQLGDSIRDEMSAEQAKTFISSVAPAIQQALENLKTTRETLSTGVRMLTGEEQGAEMLGGEPAAGGDEMGPAEPDAMNMGDEMGDMGAEDEFAAAEPAAGGLGDAGREQRESINRSSSLLKVLAG